MKIKIKKIYKIKISDKIYLEDIFLICLTLLKSKVLILYLRESFCVFASLSVFIH